MLAIGDYKTTRRDESWRASCGSARFFTENPTVEPNDDPSGNNDLQKHGNKLVKSMCQG